MSAVDELKRSYERDGFVVVRQFLSDAEFMAWVLDPHRVKPGTTMPPLADAMPQADRQALANRLLDYLRAVPVDPGGASK